MSFDARTAGVPRVLGHSRSALTSVPAYVAPLCSTLRYAFFAVQEIRHFHGFAIVDPRLASSCFCNGACRVSATFHHDSSSRHPESPGGLRAYALLDDDDELCSLASGLPLVSALLTLSCAKHLASDKVCRKTRAASIRSQRRRPKRLRREFIVAPKP